MNKSDRYLKQDIINILDDGQYDKNPRPKYKDGTPAHTYFVTHNVRTYDLSKDEFPITTLRPIAWKSAIKEMFWIYQQESNNLDDLHKLGVHAWDDWEVRETGTIGQRYGATIKKYNIFKRRVLDDILADPYGRYHVANMWQESDFKESEGLKPCAYETIWSVRGEYLDMCLVQRSGDMLVASGAGNWNEVQYAALLMMVARHTGYKSGKFTHIVVNEQIYGRHYKQAHELLERKASRKTPKLIMNTDKSNFYDFTIDDFELVDYEPCKPQIKLELGI